MMYVRKNYPDVLCRVWTVALLKKTAHSLGATVKFVFLPTVKNRGGSSVN